MSTDWTPEYLCTLDEGCVHPSKGHSMHCQKANRDYAEKQRVEERARRLRRMAAVCDD